KARNGVARSVRDILQLNGVDRIDGVVHRLDQIRLHVEMLRGVLAKCSRNWMKESKVHEMAPGCSCRDFLEVQKASRRDRSDWIPRNTIAIVAITTPGDRSRIGKSRGSVTSTSTAIANG